MPRPRKNTENDLKSSIHVRIGAKYKEKYDKYLLERNISGAAFTRAALEYWLSIDGNPGDLSQKIDHLQELLSERDRTVLEQERLISEKERTISILQDQINLLRDQIKLQNNQPISQCINSPGLLNKNTISIKSKNNKDS